MVTINRMAVDVYQEDAINDWRAAYDAGIRLVVHKASEGVTLWDHTYAERRKAAKQAGLIWAAYHFGRGTPIDQQIENFLIHARPDADTRLVLDWETPYMLKAQAVEFLTKLDERMGRKTIVYSYSAFLEAQLGKTKVDPFFGSHPLWIAAYNNNPWIQPSWSKAVMWQYTDGVSGPMPHAVPGMPGSEGDIDCNHWYGTEDQLRAFWSGAIDMMPEDKPAKEPWDDLTFSLAPGGNMRMAWIQDSLSRLTFGVLRITGVIDPATQKAMRNFQYANRLHVDGISLLHGETETALKARLAERTKPGE